MHILHLENCEGVTELFTSSILYAINLYAKNIVHLLYMYMYNVYTKQI